MFHFYFLPSTVYMVIRLMPVIFQDWGGMLQTPYAFIIEELYFKLYEPTPWHPRGDRDLLYRICSQGEPELS